MCQMWGVTSGKAVQPAVQRQAQSYSSAPSSSPHPQASHAARSPAHEGVDGQVQDEAAHAQQHVGRGRHAAHHGDGVHHENCGVGAAELGGGIGWAPQPSIALLPPPTNAAVVTTSATPVTNTQTHADSLVSDRCSSWCRVGSSVWPRACGRMSYLPVGREGGGKACRCTLGMQCAAAEERTCRLMQCWLEGSGQVLGYS